MAYSNQYLVREVQTKDKRTRVVFRTLSVSKHPKVAEVILGLDFAKLVGGSFAPKSFTVTSGGYETPFGFQLTILGASGYIKRDLRKNGGTSYPPSLNEDEFLSEVIFTHKAKDGDYEVRLFWNYLEIEPSPPPRILKLYIQGLKGALTKCEDVFLASAEEKLESAMANLLEGRFRSATHNAYYALYNTVQALAVRQGKSPMWKRNPHSAMKGMLSQTLQSIFTGDYSEYTRSEPAFRSIDRKRYSKMPDELFKMRQEVDYESQYEASEAVTKLVNILLRTAEFLHLAHSVIEGSVTTRDGSLPRIFDREHILEPYPKESFHALTEDRCRLMQSGLILAEDFVPSKLLVEFLSLGQVYYSHVDPTPFGDGLFVKYEKHGNEGSVTAILGSDKGTKKGYLQLTPQTAAKWSQMLKQAKIESLKLKTQAHPERVIFSDGRHFYEFYVLTDGRFYITSLLSEEKATEQIQSILKVREALSKLVLSIWEFNASITFSPISVLTPRK